MSIHTVYIYICIYMYKLLEISYNYCSSALIQALIVPHLWCLVVASDLWSGTVQRFLCTLMSHSPLPSKQPRASFIAGLLTHTSCFHFTATHFGTLPYTLYGALSSRCRSQGEVWDNKPITPLRCWHKPQPCDTCVPPPPIHHCLLHPSKTEKGRKRQLLWIYIYIK